MATLTRLWKPAALTLLLAFSAFLISAFARFLLQAQHLADLWSWGFPLAFYEVWGPCPPGQICRSFQLIPLLLDLLFWLVLSAILVAALRTFHSLWTDAMTD